MGVFQDIVQTSFFKSLLKRSRMIRVTTICQVGIFVKFLNFLLLIYQTQTLEVVSYSARRNILLYCDVLWTRGVGEMGLHSSFKSCYLVILALQNYTKDWISKSHFPWPVKTQICEEEEIYFLKHVFFFLLLLKHLR